MSVMDRLRQAKDYATNRVIQAKVDRRIRMKQKLEEMQAKNKQAAEDQKLEVAYAREKEKSKQYGFIHKIKANLPKGAGTGKLGGNMNFGGGQLGGTIFDKDRNFSFQKEPKRKRPLL